MTACDLCAEARARIVSRPPGEVIECGDCGRRHRAPRVREIVVVFRADDPDDIAPLSPIAQQRAQAVALHVEDAELSRVRQLLAGLRPDHPDPWEPMPLDAASSHIRVGGSSRAPWDVDLPRGLGSAMPSPPADVVTAAEILARIARMPADARAVLRWLRSHASLASGLRGLHHDVGRAFASAEQAAAWADLGARRIGAPVHGRRLTLRACDAWEGRAGAAMGRDG